MTAELIALTAELRTTTDMLGHVLERLDAADKRARRHRAGTWVLAATVIAISVLGVLFWQDQNQQAHHDCLRSKQTRRDIREAIVTSVEVVSVGSSDPERAQDVIDRIEANLIKILPDRICT